MANTIASSLVMLKKFLAKKGVEYEVFFGQGVKISKSELGKLLPQNQRFGCMPSKAVYDKGANLAEVDPLEYRYRSAGGHIHIGDGYKPIPGFAELIKKNPNDFVKILDIIVGNTCVLFDRSPENKRRRKLYGRAGEYRLPKHGIEYRTPSNFWLQNYILMSMVFGLTRLAVDIARDDFTRNSFINAVDLGLIQKAINENDFKLALANYKTIIPLLEEGLANGSNWAMGDYGLTVDRLETLSELAISVNEKGIGHWLDVKDPWKHWLKLPEAHDIDGFGDWIVNVVPRKLQRDKETEKKN